MKIAQHWLQEATISQSPNHDDRPDANDISLIVIHCISLPPGNFGGRHIDQLFTNRINREEHPYFQEICHLRVSAHLLIDRLGRISQYVPFDKRAWHAGKSSYLGREKCNDFSIGIELEGTETTAYTDAQYLQLARVMEALFRHYPGLSDERITGHCDIAPGRKQDPGDSFDWQRLKSLLHSSTFDAC